MIENKINVRQIIFSPDMVHAILDGRKTMTRRVVKHPPFLDHHGKFSVKYLDDGFFSAGYYGFCQQCENDEPIRLICPYGEPGDHLLVREAWRVDRYWDIVEPSHLPPRISIEYRAGPKHLEDPGKYRSPWFMPWRMSRIRLEIVNVRAERLQDISEEDAKAEGAIKTPKDKTYKDNFKAIWIKIKGRDSWESSPWVWCIEFKGAALGGCRYSGGRS